jgi:hypothetical protein
MAHNFILELNELARNHPVRAAFGSSGILRACSTGCGAVLDLASGKTCLISAPASTAPESCPRARVSEARAASAPADVSARSTVSLTDELVAAALLVMRMPSAVDLERDRKHPLQAVGDAELLAAVEEKRADKYSVVSAWHACIAVIQRRVAVCTTAAWLHIGYAATPAGAGSASSPSTPAPAGAAARADARRALVDKVDLANRANGHPILRAAENDATQQVSSFTLKELLESVLVDQLTALGASAWVAHLQLSGKRWAVSATQAVRIENGRAQKVPWFWHWSEARAREATAGQLKSAGVMKIRAASELTGPTEFDPTGLNFNWLSWLARLGLLVAGKNDPAGAQMLAVVWAGVNRTYLAAEKDVYKMYRHSAVMAGGGDGGGKGSGAVSGGGDASGGAANAAGGGANGAASGGGGGGGAAKRSGGELASQAKRSHCKKCQNWHSLDKGCAKENKSA